MTSSTQPSELGPEPSDHLGRVEHWCEVVIWLAQQHQQDYLDGELRSRLAIYHAIGLIADAARGLRPEVLQDVPSVNWGGTLWYANYSGSPAVARRQRQCLVRSHQRCAFAAGRSASVHRSAGNVTAESCRSITLE